MTWFADKLGPDQRKPIDFNEARRRQAGAPQQTAQAKPGRGKAAPPKPEPEKKKKKGWF